MNLEQQWQGAEEAPAAADNDSCTIAEIGVWMAWITEARNSGEMGAQTGVPVTWTPGEEEIAVTETVDVEQEEDTAGKELSKLFLVRRGGMAGNDECKAPEKHWKITSEWTKLPAEE